MATGNIITTVKIIKNKLIDASQATYVRGKKLEFTLSGLMPDTKLYAFTGSGKQLNSRVRLYKELVLANAISWTTADGPVTVNQSGFTANAVMIVQNRVFIKDTETTGTVLVGSTLSLTKNLQTVNTTLLNVISSSNVVVTNDFGAAAGYIDIPDNYVPAGDVEIIFSDAANGKGVTYASTVYQASGIIEKYADITITTNINDPDIIGLPGEIRCGTKLDPKGIDFEPGTLSATWDLWFDVYGYIPELYGNDDTYETFAVRLPINSKPGTTTDYEITGITNSGSGYYTYVSGLATKTVIKNVSNLDSITIKVKRRDIVSNARTILKMIVNDTALTTQKAVSLTLTDVYSTYFAFGTPSITCPVSPPAPTFEPIFWLKDQEATFVLTYGNSDGVVTGSLVMAASGDGSQSGFYYGVNPGGLFGRPANFTLEWIPISGWTGTYFIGANDSYLLPTTNQTIERVNGNTSTPSSPEFRKYLNGVSELFTFPSPYNPPSTGPGGNKYVKKGKLRLTVSEQVTGGRTSSVESGIITVYTIEPQPVVVSPPVETVTTPTPPPAPAAITDAPTVLVAAAPPTPALPEPTQDPVGTEVCACVDPDTPIAISENETKRAGDLRAGDVIYTRQEFKDVYGYCKINYADEVVQERYLIKFANNSKIIVSKAHVFLCDDGLWKTADTLEAGDKLVTRSGVEILSEKVDIGLGTVVLFTTEFGTYLSQNIVSHNAVIFEPGDSEVYFTDNCGYWDDYWYPYANYYYREGRWRTNTPYNWYRYRRSKQINYPAPAPAPAPAVAETYVDPYLDFSSGWGGGGQ